MALHVLMYIATNSTSVANIMAALIICAMDRMALLGSGGMGLFLERKK